MSNNLYPKALVQLIQHLKALPGIGQKTAERLAIDIVSWPEEQTTSLAKLLDVLKTSIKHCCVCGNYSEGEKCSICQDKSRDEKTICVVEQPSQIAVIEKSSFYRGLYHVLGGKIKPLDDIGPEELTLDSLLSRAESPELKEVILATSSDVEGEATASYIAEELKKCDIKITRLATGLPVGADISYTDISTLTNALSRRYEY
ncbi:MAG: recombination mediator RecR [Verrucomicrobiota bacterium]|nr:recombination mediator RecR [Verrucomicrobiota bacterium]